MLDVSHETELSEELWKTLESRTRLPESLRDYLQKQAGGQAMPDCQRRYARVPVRTISIALIGGQHHACYAKDLSRMGIGFYSPINLFPRQLLQLWLPSGNTVSVRVTRCRRIATGCYEVGTIYDAESEKKSS